ncbi:hypothetical protein pEaSNUABM11_00227 [Erwinia phage pEa_SNUABM_11]|nr:hypothetical protein pEaSNUABM11_00227 [Erwinia phage pEa_SNUABM_11]
MPKLSAAATSWLSRNEDWLIPLLRKVERLAPANKSYLLYTVIWMVLITAPFLIAGFFLPKTPIAVILRTAVYLIWLVLMMPVTKALIQPFVYWRYTRMM